MSGFCFNLKITAMLTWGALPSTPITAGRDGLANRLPLKTKDQSSLEICGLHYFCSLIP